MELRGEGGFFHVELAQAVLVGIGQLRAGAYQLFVVALDQTLLLRIQIQRVALVVDGLDAGEEFGVEIDLVLMRGQLGRDLFLDFLACVAGIGLHQPEEDARHARERFAAALHRFDGVVEGRRFWVIGDLADVGQMLAHAFFERRQIIGVLDLVERRRLERQRAGGQQGVGCSIRGRSRGGFLGHGGGLLARRLFSRTSSQCQGDGSGQNDGTRHGV